MHSEHDAITLGAALLLWFVGLVAIGIAVLARMGRFTERPVEFADYATWLAAGLSVGAAPSYLAIISELFTADGAEGVFFAIVAWAQVASALLVIRRWTRRDRPGHVGSNHAARA
jgi:hypothetical protein